MGFAQKLWQYNWKFHWIYGVILWLKTKICYLICTQIFENKLIKCIFGMRRIQFEPSTERFKSAELNRKTLFALIVTDIFQYLQYFICAKSHLRLLFLIFFSPICFKCVTKRIFEINKRTKKKYWIKYSNYSETDFLNAFAPS